MKNIILFFLVASFPLISFGQSTQEWFAKVPSYINYGYHQGKLSVISRCSITIVRSDKGGLMVDLSKTKITDIFGDDDVSLASFHILPSDSVVASAKYPLGPIATDKVLSFGYASAAFTIEKINERTLAVTVEEEQAGKRVSKTCTIKN